MPFAPSLSKTKSAPVSNANVQRQTLRGFGDSAVDEAQETDVQTQLGYAMQFGHGVSQPVQRQAEPGLEEEEETLQRQAESGLEEEEEELPVQAKLTIGQPGDKYEQEADQMAAKVMRMPEPGRGVGEQGSREALVQPVPEEEEEIQAKPLVQREAISEEDEELARGRLQRQAMPDEKEEEEVQMRPAVQQEVVPEEETLQARLQAKGGTPEVPGGFEGQLASHRGGGQPLSDQTRAFMEPRFGADFSGVRVHETPDLANAIQAQAFTHGQDIYFNSGKYNPGSSGGKELLAHELTHVVQQNSLSIHPQVSMRQKTGQSFSHWLQEDGQRFPRLKSRLIKRGYGISFWTHTDSWKKIKEGERGKIPWNAPAKNFMWRISRSGKFIARITTKNAISKCEDILSSPARKSFSLWLQEDGKLFPKLKKRLLREGYSFTLYAYNNSDGWSQEPERNRNLWNTLANRIKWRVSRGREDLTSWETTKTIISRCKGLLSASEEESSEEKSVPETHLWDNFSKNFNKEFNSILHAFKKKSDENVTTQKLKAVFTKTQRDKLMSFISTKQIPDQLFNGDDALKTTAQQRLLLSSHILANGQYRPGSDEKKIHANYCFHWIHIVHHYAGTTPNHLTSGVMGSFDHSGNTILGSGRSSKEFEGSDEKKRPETITESELPEQYDPVRRIGPIPPKSGHEKWAKKNPGKAFRRPALPLRRLKGLEAGDWLYIYNASKSRSGMHSVIFSHWLESKDEDQASPTIYNSGKQDYLKAKVFSQFNPQGGGREHTVALGEDFEKTNNGRITPVIEIIKVSREAHPISTIDELFPSVSDKKTDGLPNNLSRKTKAKLEERYGSPMFLEKFRKDVRLYNLKHINYLSEALNEGQKGLFLEANKRKDFESLLRLAERLRVLKSNYDIAETQPTYDEISEHFSNAERKILEIDNKILKKEKLLEEITDRQILRQTRAEIRELKARKKSLKRDNKVRSSKLEVWRVHQSKGGEKQSISSTMSLQRILEKTNLLEDLFNRIKV